MVKDYIPLKVYLGVKIDRNLTWLYHVDDLSIKLNRANALYFKMRKYVSIKILRSFYFPIFDSYLSYCSLVWTQNLITIQQILILQKKPVRIINLQLKNTRPYQSSIQAKLCIKIPRENLSRKYFLCQQSLSSLLPSFSNTCFSFSSDQLNYETSSLTQGNLMKLFLRHLKID